jgi:hypothetical protein
MNRRVWRRWFRTAAAATLVLAGGAPPAAAQTPWSYRARVAVEGTATRANPARPVVSQPGLGWDASGLFVATGDSSWESGGRLRLAGGVTLTGSDGGHVDVQAREAFARFSANSWMDLEAGKRLVRWGVGYGFSPTGVLDPPRVATDPNDRLGRNEGMLIVRADVFRGATSLTVAGAAPGAWRDVPASTPERVLAARLRTVVGTGVEIALVASAAPGTRVAYGGNVTHVVGQQLEWHAEMLLHDRAPDSDRTLSAVAGLQYTFTAGANVVVEYHRNGRGLNDDEWTTVMRGERAPGPAPGRQQFLFIRAARAGADDTVAPEMIVIAGLDDGGWTLVPGVTWTPQRRVHIYARGVHLAGGRGSIAAFAPWSTSLTVGAAVRF